jgi:putative glutamine amidotransferase
MKPLIGITSGTKDERYSITVSYAKWVNKCGGVPIVIPIDTDFNPVDYDYLDGLILSGGSDIDPSHYGQEPERDLGIVNTVRDELEFALLSALKHKPVLGICRGMQLMNVAAGGTLFQDLHTSEGSTAYLAHKLKSLNEEEPLMHSLNIVAGSYLETLLDVSELRVMSTHHQAIKDVGKGLVVSATSKDGVIEVINGEDANHFWLGLQWHPEKRNFTDKDSVKIFTTFIDCCRVS